VPLYDLIKELCETTARARGVSCTPEIIEMAFKLCPEQPSAEYFAFSTETAAQEKWFNKRIIDAVATAFGGAIHALV
jgi:hypothetical protein